MSRQDDIYRIIGKLENMIEHLHNHGCKQHKELRRELLDEMYNLKCLLETQDKKTHKHIYIAWFVAGLGLLLGFLLAYESPQVLEVIGNIVKIFI